VNVAFGIAADPVNLTRAGSLTEFAAMNVQLNGEQNGLKGDFRESEWAGATCSPDEK